MRGATKEALRMAEDRIRREYQSDMEELREEIKALQNLARAKVQEEKEEDTQTRHVTKINHPATEAAQRAFTPAEQPAK